MEREPSYGGRSTKTHIGTETFYFTSDKYQVYHSCFLCRDVYGLASDLSRRGNTPTNLSSVGQLISSAEYVSFKERLKEGVS